MKIFTVYDEPAGAFLQPFFEKTRATAIRSFMDACSRPDHQFVTHSSDYTLFAVGDFDEVTGLITAYPVPERIIGAAECVAAHKEKGA